MELTEARAFLTVIKTEELRRVESLDPECEYDEWLGEAPFINELCLLFLVALRHHIERSLKHLAARALDNGVNLTKADYEERIHRKNSMKQIEVRLDLPSCAHYPSAETLRLLANSYKHNCQKKPAADLLEHLKLDRHLDYSEIPESEALRRAIAYELGLSEHAGYIEVSERLVDHSYEFLKDIERRNVLSRIIRGPVSLTRSCH